MSKNNLDLIPIDVHGDIVKPEWVYDGVRGEFNPIILADVTYRNGYGYEDDGDGGLEPTNHQIQLQDEVDGAIQSAVDTMASFYSEAADVGEFATDHDIGKLTEIRELIESLYGMPDIY